MKKTLSIAELDTFECCDAYARARTNLLAFNGDVNHQFSWRQLTEAGVQFADVRDPLFPIARVAQTNLEMRALLTRFIADCQIHSLEAFERKWPGDHRPRAAIEATGMLLTGKICNDAWLAAADASLIAWAGYFAPEPLVGNGMWAAVETKSWQSVDPDELSGWVHWARWAVLAMKAHFLCEQKNNAFTVANLANESEWALRRLGQYLSDDRVVPLSPMSAPLQSGKGPFSTATGVDDIEIDWNSFLCLPEGVERLGSVSVGQNSSFDCPASVTSIESISVYRATVVLPGNVREIGNVSAYDGSLTIENGLLRIDHLTVDDEDSEINLPNTLEFIGTIRLDRDYEVPQSVIRIDKIVMDNDDKFENPEEYDLEEGSYAVIRCGERFASPMTNLDFASAK